MDLDKNQILGAYRNQPCHAYAYGRETREDAGNSNSDLSVCGQRILARPARHGTADFCKRLLAISYRNPSVFRCAGLKSLDL